jgi:hypothetical protein
MLGIRNYILPLTGGVNNTAYEQTASDLPYLDGARAQGGIAGFMHPYLNAGKDAAGWSGSLIPVDVALGKGEFYDVASLYSDELASAEMYYKLLNCGFRLAATGGTDNFPTSSAIRRRDRSHLREGRWTADRRLVARGGEGRTNVRNHGPADHARRRRTRPGQRTETDGQRSVRITIRARSISPIDRIELIVNGRVVQSAAAADLTARLDAALPVPDGGWIAARAIGPASKYVGDSYAFAQTTPVYVVRNGRTFISQDDARFLADVVDAIWARADRAPWRSPAERERFKDEIERAKAVYLRLAAG